MNIRAFLTTIFVVGTLACYSQQNYEPIDKGGWEITNFAIPDNLAEADTGRVVYLVKLNKKGRLTNIKILSNSFPEHGEKLWRRQVRKIIFVQEPAGQTKYQGTLYVSREPCSNATDDPDWDAN